MGPVCAGEGQQQITAVLSGLEKVAVRTPEVCAYAIFVLQH
jgi:hypothetical protein